MITVKSEDAFYMTSSEARDICLVIGNMLLCDRLCVSKPYEPQEHSLIPCGYPHCRFSTGEKCTVQAMRDLADMLNEAFTPDSAKFVIEEYDDE